MRILLLIATTLSLAFAADHYSHADILKYIDSTFHLVDSDHSGALSKAEIEHAFLRNDADHDNNVTLAEFASDYAANQMTLVKAVFDLLDTNKDGMLDNGEGTHALHHQLDKDHNGMITRAEYDRFYTGLVVYAENHEANAPGHDHGPGHHHHGHGN